MTSRAGTLFLLSGIGTVLCAGVALHEWFYRHTHRHAGVSTVLIVLALGGALIGAAVAWSMWDAHQEQIRRRPLRPPDGL